MTFVPIEELRAERDVWAVGARVHILVPPQAVWEALTTAEGLARWWCTTAEVDLRPGGKLLAGGETVYGADVENPEVLSAGGKILALEAPRSLAFEWPLLGAATIAAFALEPTATGTRVAVRQSSREAPAGWKTAETPNWWTVGLANLRAVLEDGAREIEYSLKGGVEEPVVLRARITTFPWVIWGKLAIASELRRWLGTEVAVPPPGGPSPQAEQHGEARPRLLEVEADREVSLEWPAVDGPAERVRLRVEPTEEDTFVVLTVEGSYPGIEERRKSVILWAGRLAALARLSERGLGSEEAGHE